MKEPTIFVYQAINTEDAKDLKKLFDENEKLKYLKDNKYYSIKALSYPRDIDNIHQIKNLVIEIGYPQVVDIEPGKMFTHSLYVFLFIKLLLLNC